MNRVSQHRALLVVAALFLAACGGGPGAGPTPPPTGTVQGTVQVDSGTTPAAAARVVQRTVEPRRIQGLPRYVPDQIIVKFRPAVQAQEAQSLHASVGGHVIRVIQQLGVHVVKLPPGASLQAALATYRASPLVVYAEQDAYVYALATPNDQFYSLQWHYPKIGLPAAWDATTGHPVIVAVVDTGIRPDHPDLLGITVSGYDYVDNDPDPTDPGCPADPNQLSHGTHVAGTVAALTNNSIGVAGVTWGGVSAVKIMPNRVLDGCGTGTASAVVLGIIHAAANGAKVINLSLASDADLQVVRDVVQYALNLGVTLIAAAGNDNSNTPRYPAAYPGVIAVSATACDDTKASYSNYGAHIWVAAPGGDSTSNCPNTDYRAWVWSTSWSPNSGNVYPGKQGTSMAAPHVSGVAALLISRGFTTPDAIRARLRDTAVDRGPTGWDQYFGYGLVNAAAAVGASNPNATMRAFSGIVSGTTITRQSDFGSVAAAGSFTIPNAQSGTKSVFVWQDFNNNGVVDPPDSYGRKRNVVINPGQTTTGVVVTVNLYAGPPLSVSGP